MESNKFFFCGSHGCSWTPAVLRPWYEVCFFFNVFARMVDATLMMGVLGWGGGDGNVP